MVKLEMTRGMATNISVEKALEYCQYNCFDVNRSNPSSLTIDSAISGSTAHWISYQPQTKRIMLKTSYPKYGNFLNNNPVSSP